MIDAPRLLLNALLAALFGWVSFARADNDVTVVSSSTTTPATTKKTTDTNPDGTPVVHKSSHKKKKTTQTASTDPSVPAPASTTVITHTSTGFTSTMPHQVQFPPVSRNLPPAPANMLPGRPVTSTTTTTGTRTPAVETGLPKALPGVSTYQPPMHTYVASNVPPALPPRWPPPPSPPTPCPPARRRRR